MKTLLSRCCHKALGTVPRKVWPRQCRRTASFQGDVNRVRNVGIMAHIDAGKTTTTERFLFFSGIIRNLGNVDSGSTVTDYMEQERERGITITSAVVSFPWNRHVINLIDTPGHIDFTVEVERALRVLDGAVVILDASAGVEAQTRTVWKQGKRYEIPAIAYVNKMDKFGASWKKTLASIRSNLQVEPLPLQVPSGNRTDFTFVYDLVRQQKLGWNSVGEITETLAPLDEIVEHREELMHKLADLDDVMAEHVISEKSSSDLSEEEWNAAIRRVTFSRKAVPVLFGSSLKNMGVQPLMQAICLYLPSPVQRDFPFQQLYEDSLCALAFKTIHDGRKGQLTFVRIYGGTVQSGSSLFNVSKFEAEHQIQCFTITANEFERLSRAGAGAIVALSGLKHTFTGDTLTSSKLSAQSAIKKSLASHKGKIDADDVDGKDNADAVILSGLQIPQPVFFCTVEPPSQGVQHQFDAALACLNREDPSLSINIDDMSGEIVLGGQGELHLEIIKDRLLKEFKLEVNMGKIFIAYRESIDEPSTSDEFVLDHKIGEKRQKVEVCLSVRHEQLDDGPATLKLEPLDDDESLKKLDRHRVKAIERGIAAGLGRGPVMGFPVADARVYLHKIVVKYGTAHPMLTAAVARAVKSCLARAKPYLLQPMMLVEILCDESKSSGCVIEISRRSGQIKDLSSTEGVTRAVALIPLSNIVGFSSSLRKASSGFASFTMKIDHYERVSESEQKALLNNRLS